MYSRTLDGKELTLAPSGWTYKNTFLLYDRETMSMWYPYQDGLRGITGEHFNKVLPLIDSDDTRWDKWVEKHPSSKVMD